MIDYMCCMTGGSGEPRGVQRRVTRLIADRLGALTEVWCARFCFQGRAPQKLKEESP